MSAQLTRPVVVGVDGSEEGLQAVRYAAAEAHRVGCGVRLVHVLPELAATAPIVPLSGFEAFAAVADKILGAATRAAEETAGDALAVEGIQRTGSRVHHLVDVSRDARLVVLGHRDRSVLGRVFTSSTSEGVAGRARCPVVCVPQSWRVGVRHGRIVAGVEDPDHAHEVLTRAFEAALERRAELTVLHAWKLQRPYDDVVAHREGTEQWNRWMLGRFQTALTDLKSAYPEVDLHIDVRHQDPATSLLGASEGADLLLLGRRGHGGPLSLHLGSLARALIREARCPVEIAPLHPDHLDTSTPDLALTAADLSPQT